MTVSGTTTRSRRTLFAMLGLLFALVPRAAGATNREWIEGNSKSSEGSACITGTPQFMTTAWAGYFGTRDATFPEVGDITNLHAVGGVVGNFCVGDVIRPEFFLPIGATLAISPTNPVQCIATRLSDGTQVTQHHDLACSQTPIPGPNGGLIFGWASIEMGWIFEVLVPVRFNQELHGLAGGPAEKLRVIVTTTLGDIPVEALLVVPLPPPPPPITRSIALGQPIAFTGTSATIHSEGPFVQIAGTPTRFRLPANSRVNVHLDFVYGYPAGPSSMELDVRLLVDGVEANRVRVARFATSVDLPTNILPAGSHTTTVEVRSVLLNGPPTTVTLRGNWNWWDAPGKLQVTRI